MFLKERRWKRIIEIAKTQYNHDSLVRMLTTIKGVESKDSDDGKATIVYIPKDRFRLFKRNRFSGKGIM